MSGGEDGFRIRPGRIGNRGGPRAKTFVAMVLRAARKAGYSGWVRSGSRQGGASHFGRGRTAFARTRLFSSHRRVMVKARPVLKTPRSAPLSAHIAYLKREGVTRDGARAQMFGAETDRADDAGFAERCKDDRHHFRFIVSPEDAGEMTDLKAFTRDLVAQMEADLGTKLDWVAVDHWNTDNPHVHLLVRGVRDDGHDLVIARDYIGKGMRSRAEELVALELGPKPEHEMRQALELEVDAERWTRLDTELRRQSDERGFIDLRPARPGSDDAEFRRLMIGRLQRLERMGLAAPTAPGQWTVALDAEGRLRDLGRRGDIIRTMQRAFAGRGQDRGIADYVIDRNEVLPPVIGRLVDKGLHDELTGEAYAVIDGVDGHAHHVRFRGVEAFADAPPIGGIVELRRLDDRRTVLAARSDFDLRRQITAPGATWLDHRLVEREAVPLSSGGFGGEVRASMEARVDHLVEDGLARRQGQRVIFARNLLATLRQRELDTVGARLAVETGQPYVPAASGDAVAGDYRQRLTLTSGRFAMIDNGLGFSLVPWSPTLDRHLGRHVSGLARGDGGIDWSFGRKRGLGL